MEQTILILLLVPIALLREIRLWLPRVEKMIKAIRRFRAKGHQFWF